MIVTLDCFSGRPNPSWRLSEKDNARLLERITGRPLAAVEEVTADVALGPRGFVVEASGDDEVPENLPSAFRVGAPAAAAEGALTVSETAEVSNFLLNTGRHVVEPGLMEFLAGAIQKQAQPEALAGAELWPEPAEPADEGPEPVEPGPEVAAEAGIVLPLPPCVIANTRYNPGFWNVPAVQPKNNCYNYAMNYRSDTFAQPGRISGHMYAAINCAAVGTAANWDGCHTYCSGSNKNVALVIAPGPGFVDFHWYRRHLEGFWGHKPGGTAARNTDNRGRLIDGRVLTPQNCDRGPYTIFCGYRFSPTGMRVR